MKSGAAISKVRKLSIYRRCMERYTREGESAKAAIERALIARIKAE